MGLWAAVTFPVRFTLVLVWLYLAAIVGAPALADGALDVSNFDQKYTLEAPVLSPLRRPLSGDMEAQFEALELEYMSPETRNSVRDSMRSTLLAQCGMPWDRRFSFYDQVHTTGMDIKQSPNARAVVTIGKDMTFRDYAQGAYRMRGIGVGQTITLYLIPEVVKRMEAEKRSLAKKERLRAEAAAASGDANSA